MCACLLEIIVVVYTGEKTSIWEGYLEWVYVFMYAFKSENRQTV